MKLAKLIASSSNDGKYAARSPPGCCLVDENGDEIEDNGAASSSDDVCVDAFAMPEVEGSGFAVLFLETSPTIWMIEFVVENAADSIGSWQRARCD